MDNGKKNAIAQFTAVANNRYNSLTSNSTRLKLFNLLSLKSSSNNYSGAFKDIERIVLIFVKEQGHQSMLNLISDIRDMNSNSGDSLVILNEISEYDQSCIIKKKLKAFKFNKKAVVQVPHEIKVLFNHERINIDDIQKYEAEIKARCNLTDDFFINAVRSDSNFQNYGMIQNNQPIQCQTMQQFNPYQNLLVNSSFQAILPPAQDPLIPPPQQTVYPPSNIPIVSPTSIPFVPYQNNTQELPQYYYLNPPYQPPPPS